MGHESSYFILIITNIKIWVFRDLALFTNFQSRGIWDTIIYNPDWSLCKWKRSRTCEAKSNHQPSAPSFRVTPLNLRTTTPSAAKSRLSYWNVTTQLLSTDSLYSSSKHAITSTEKQTLLWYACSRSSLIGSHSVWLKKIGRQNMKPWRVCDYTSKSTSVSGTELLIASDVKQRGVRALGLW